MIAERGGLAGWGEKRVRGFSEKNKTPDQWWFDMVFLEVLLFPAISWW
jgi:hypothetical protein